MSRDVNLLMDELRNNAVIEYYPADKLVYVMRYTPTGRVVNNVGYRSFYYLLRTGVITYIRDCEGGKVYGVKGKKYAK